MGKRKGIHVATCRFTPAKIEQNETGEIVVEDIEIKKPKKKQYYPGERLLIEMNKTKNKRNKKLHKSKKSIDVDVDMIEKSIKRLLSEW